MPRSALALILSAPVVCLAFAPKRLQTRGALKLSSLATTVDISSPAAMGVQINSFLDNMKEEELDEFRLVCSEKNKDGSLTTLLDWGVRELHEANNEPIPEDRQLRVGIDTSGAACWAETPFCPKASMDSVAWQHDDYLDDDMLVAEFVECERKGYTCLPTGELDMHKPGKDQNDCNTEVFRRLNVKAATESNLYAFRMGDPRIARGEKLPAEVGVGFGVAKGIRMPGGGLLQLDVGVCWDNDGLFMPYCAHRGVSYCKKYKMLFLFCRDLMCEQLFKHDNIKSTIYALALTYGLLPDTSHNSAIYGPTIPEKLKADVFKKLRYHVIVGKLIAFVADVHAAFLASGRSYLPNGRSDQNLDPGFLAGYLKKIQTRELRIPDNITGDSMKIMKYIMNLPEQNLKIMWRRAKRYNVVAEWQLRD